MTFLLTQKVAQDVEGKSLEAFRESYRYLYSGEIWNLGLCAMSRASLAPHNIDADKTDEVRVFIARRQIERYDVIKNRNLDAYQHTFYRKRDGLAELPFAGERVRCHASESFGSIVGSDAPNAQITVTTRYDISTTCKIFARFSNELIITSRNDKMLSCWMSSEYRRHCSLHW